jgi:hypothetical protein
MDKSVRVYDIRQEMKADEYRYWQSRPVHERMSAVAELTLSAYAMKEPARDVRRLQKTLVCLQRAQAGRLRDLADVEEIRASEPANEG